MAAVFYVTIEGMKQGKFLGDGGHSFKNTIVGLAFKYEVASPHDLASGSATGKVQHQPVILVKEWGASSPQIYQALVDNELLNSVFFEFVKTEVEGTESIYHTIKLTNARVAKVSLHVDGPSPGTPGNTRELEEVSFVFQQIEVINVPGRTTAKSDTGKAGAQSDPGFALSRVAAAGAAGGAADKADRIVVAMPQTG